MTGYFKMPVSDKRMSEVMYALLRVRGRLVNSYSHWLYSFSRKQARGFLVDMVVGIEDSKVALFEELASVKLQTSGEFQGKITLNS